MHADAVLAILAMAVATYATRLAGLLLGPLLPRTGRLRRALDALPIAVLTAVIAPAVATGRAELIAGALAALAATRLPLLGVIAVGMAAVAGLRAVL